MERIKDGYTRISDILSIYQAYTHVPRDRLKKAQEAGTIIHEAIESYYKGDFSPVPMKHLGLFDSFLSWAKDQEMEILALEKRFYDDSLMITGRIDLFAKVGNKTVVIDFKTGSLAHPVIWRLQGTFYRHLISLGCWPTKSDKQIVLPPDEFMFVQLQRDGSPPIIHKYTYSFADWEMCIRSLDSYHYFKKYSQ